MAACSSDEENVLRKIPYSQFTDKLVLADGLHCEVYSANHPDFGKCCLRFFAKFFIPKERVMRQLESEVNNLARLEHRNIVKILAFVMEHQKLCHVLEFVHYGSLIDTLHRIVIPNPLKIRIAYQTAEVMRFLHSHNPPILHKSLKSGNILLDADFNIKLSDVTLPGEEAWSNQAARQKDITDRRKQASGDTSMFNRPGWTIAYIPPENIRNINRHPTKQYDIFSYGIILWEMLAERRPYQGLKTDVVFQSISDGQLLNEEGIKRGSPRVLEDIMMGTFTLEPEQRTSSFEDITTKLLSHLHEGTIAQSVEISRRRYDKYLRLKREGGDPGVISEGAEPEVPRQTTLPSTASLLSPDEQETSQALPVSTPTPQQPTRNHAQPSVQPIGDDRTFYEPMEPPGKRGVEQPGTSGIHRQMHTITVHPDPSAPPLQPEDSQQQEESESSQEVFDDDVEPKVLADPFLDARTAPAPRSESRTSLPHGIQITVRYEDPVPGSSSPPQSPRDASPAAGSTRTINVKDIYVVADEIGHRWKRMARLMGLGEGDIDAINHDNDREGLKEKAFKTVTHWKKRNPHVTVGGLVAELELMGEYSIAAKLQP